MPVSTTLRVRSRGRRPFFRVLKLLGLERFYASRSYDGARPARDPIRVSISTGTHRDSMRAQRRDRLIKWASIAAILVGVLCIAQGMWIHAKAQVAQMLISAAWQRTQKGETNAKPWPWADTHPIVQLSLGRDTPPLMVLEGVSGRNLAFGPTHDPASVLPGDNGNSVISGHRDTHFKHLRSVQPGDRIRVDLANGRTHWFVVSDISIADSRDSRISLESDTPRLTLVTCYPFDAIEPGGPLRYVVTADWIAGAGNAPPRREAHAAVSH